MIGTVIDRVWNRSIYLGGSYRRCLDYSKETNQVPWSFEGYLEGLSDGSQKIQGKYLNYRVKITTKINNSNR